MYTKHIKSLEWKGKIMCWRRILLGGVLAIGVVTAMFTWSVDRVETGDKDLPTQVKDYMKWHHINGVALVSGKKGQPVVVKNKETSNKEKVVEANRLFPIASLQKIMTGTAIYKLKQTGQLDWNTSLSTYYPQIPGSKSITIRELLNHTSGLINNARPDSPLKGEKEQTAFMLKHIKYDHLHTWDYQDIDYELLAAIISKQTHLSYNDYIKQTFAGPLNLRQIKDFSEVAKNEVPQPINNVSWHEVTVTTSSDFGAGNLFMSPKDYWKFINQAVLKNPKMINTFSQQTQHEEVAYFGGVYFHNNVIAGNGSIPGYNSCFIANYKTKETVMMFSNNIDYWDLKEDSDYILHHYVGYRPELRF